MGLALLLLLAILVARAIYGVVARARVHFVLSKGPRGTGRFPLSAFLLAAPPASCCTTLPLPQKLKGKGQNLCKGFGPRDGSELATWGKGWEKGKLINAAGAVLSRAERYPLVGWNSP